MNEVNGFIKADGQRLINGSGQEVLLRGMGLGSWLLPEGYMWCFPDEGDRPRRIERMIEKFIGKKKSKQFWKEYYERYISETDIRQIAHEGFNSIRLPINSRFLMEEAGERKYNEQHLHIIDRVIGWCRTYGLYIILDLHGAPGGQTGTNIDDSENNKPELFTIEKNKSLTVELWRMLAKRYKDEWIIAGYDLLNEPLPEWFSAYNDQVMPLYKDIVKAIREVDSSHMIILEGVHWATDWSIFNEKIDDNLMLQFHKYWNNPDTESIEPYLNKRREFNVPIFMGEGGENNKEWYAGAFRLFEDHNISWNFWTWKKINTDNSPCSINIPSEWNMLVDFLQGGAKPDRDTSEHILWEYIENICFDHCVYHPEVVCSIFRRPPVRIPAAFYGFKGEGVSFGANSMRDQQVGFRRQDWTHISFVEGERLKTNFSHGRGEPWQEDEWLCVQLDHGDWLAFEFNTKAETDDIFYSLEICLCAPEGESSLAVWVDGLLNEILETKEKVWKILSLKIKLQSEEDLHKIVLKSEKNAIQVKWLKIIPLRIKMY